MAVTYKTNLFIGFFSYKFGHIKFQNLYSLLLFIDLSLRKKRAPAPNELKKKRRRKSENDKEDALSSAKRDRRKVDAVLAALRAFSLLTHTYIASIKCIAHAAEILWLRYIKSDAEISASAAECPLPLPARCAINKSQQGAG